MLPEVSTGEELNVKAVSDDEDGSADDEEFVGSKAETTAEVDVVGLELDPELAPVDPEFVIDEALELNDVGLGNGPDPMLTGVGEVVMACWR